MSWDKSSSNSEAAGSDCFQPPTKMFPVVYLNSIMAINLSKKEVEKASCDALIVITSTQAFVVERVAGGGIDDPRVEENCSIFPISMVKNGENYLPGGDWTVVPFVKKNGQKIESSYDYWSFSINWV